jgi:hypothetical protein
MTTQTLENRAKVLKELRLVVTTRRLAGCIMHDVQRNDDRSSNFFNQKAEEMMKTNTDYLNNNNNCIYIVQRVTTGY